MADIVTDTGEAIITNRLKGSGTEPLFLSWGTGAGTAAKANTTLFTESTSTANSAGNNIRVTGTSTQQTVGSTNDTYQVVGTLIADVGKTITNVGLFDTNGAQVSPAAPSGGNIFCKSDFTGIVLAGADSIVFTLKITIT